MNEAGPSRPDAQGGSLPSPSHSQVPQDSGAPAFARFDSMADFPGKMLGQYKIERRIGQGGMGVVFKARDTALDREVAVKVLQHSPLDDPKTAERFQREAKSLARVRHLNLVQIYNVGSSGGLQYFAMELLEGVTLCALLRERKKLSAEEFMPSLGQLLGALQAVHKEGIIHRDMKSGNVMICPERTVLMDFGLAKDESQSGLTSVGVVLGTPDYMAPEQAEGRPMGPPTDIYSLGIIMFEALAGRLPFQGKSAYSIIRQHLETVPPRLEEFTPQISHQLAGIVQRCLAKNPSERYPDCASLAVELAEIYPLADLQRVAGAAIRRGQTGVRPRIETAPVQGHPGALTVAGSGLTPHSPSQQATLIAATGIRPGGLESPGHSNRSSAFKSQILQDNQDPRFPWAWMTIGFLLVMALGVSFWWFKVHNKDSQTISADPPAVISKPPNVAHVQAMGSDGKEVFRWLGFRSKGSDPAGWVYVIERKQPDGTWKRQEMSESEFEKVAPPGTELRFLPKEK